RSSAASSCADDRNHTSYADGGRYTPRSSAAWKNAAYALVSWRCAAAKSPTAPSVKKIENRLPACCAEWGTPSRVSASDAAFDTISAERSLAAYTSSVALRRVASPAAVARGFPDRVPAW